MVVNNIISMKTHIKIHKKNMWSCKKVEGVSLGPINIKGVLQKNNWNLFDKNPKCPHVWKSLYNQLRKSNPKFYKVCPNSTDKFQNKLIFSHIMLCCKITTSPDLKYIKKPGRPYEVLPKWILFLKKSCLNFRSWSWCHSGN